MRRWSWLAGHRHGFEHERGIEEAARSSNPRLGFLSTGSSRPPCGVWCGLTARDISWRGGAVLKEGTIVEAIKQLVKRDFATCARESERENGFDGKEQNLEQLVS